MYSWSGLHRMPVQAQFLGDHRRQQSGMSLPTASPKIAPPDNENPLKSQGQTNEAGLKIPTNKREEPCFQTCNGDSIRVAERTSRAA